MQNTEYATRAEGDEPSHSYISKRKYRAVWRRVIFGVSATTPVLARFRKTGTDIRPRLYASQANLDDLRTNAYDSLTTTRDVSEAYRSAQLCPVVFFHERHGVKNRRVTVAIRPEIVRTRMGIVRSRTQSGRKGAGTVDFVRNRATTAFETTLHLPGVADELGISILTLLLRNW